MFPDNAPKSGFGLKAWLRSDEGYDFLASFPSGAQALANIRQAGGSIRDSVFYSIRRETLELGYYTEKIIARDDNQLVPEAWTVVTDMNLSSDYLYRVRGFGTNPLNGQDVEMFFSVASDRQLTPGEIKDAVGQMVVGHEQEYSINVDHFELFEALKRG